MKHLVRVVRGDDPISTLARRLTVDIVHLAIWLIIIIVAVAIVYWVLDRTGMWARVPTPFQYVIYGVIGIVALIVLVRFAGLL